MSNMSQIFKSLLIFLLSIYTHVCLSMWVATHLFKMVLLWSHIVAMLSVQISIF